LSGTISQWYFIDAHVEIAREREWSPAEKTFSRTDELLKLLAS
jgi:hypothetical protein